MMTMKKQTPEGQALTDLILEAFRLNGAMLNAGNQLTKPHGLTSARWQVMGAIDLAGHSMTVAQIARRMGLARQGVQRIVNDLKKLGMLVLEENLDHKRAPLILLSEEGQEAMKAVSEAHVAWFNRLSEGFSERALKQTLRVLQSVRERSEKP